MWSDDLDTSFFLLSAKTAIFPSDSRDDPFRVSDYRLGFLAHDPKAITTDNSTHTKNNQQVNNGNLGRRTHLWTRTRRKKHYCQNRLNPIRHILPLPRFNDPKRSNYNQSVSGRYYKRGNTQNRIKWNISILEPPVRASYTKKNIKILQLPLSALLLGHVSPCENASMTERRLLATYTPSSIRQN